jgi:hypothetical protein
MHVSVKGAFERMRMRRKASKRQTWTPAYIRDLKSLAHRKTLRRESPGLSSSPKARPGKKRSVSACRLTRGADRTEHFCGAGAPVHQSTSASHPVLHDMKSSALNRLSPRPSTLKSAETDARIAPLQPIA